MYLYLTFFDEEILLKKKYFFSGRYLEAIRSVFPEYRELNSGEIEGCIAFFKGKDNRDKNCVALNITNFKNDANSIALEFEVEKELNVTNEFIDKS